MRPTYPFGNIIDYDGGVRPPIIHGSQRVVALLAGRIPYFKLERVPLHLQRLRQKGRYPSVSITLRRANNK